MWKSRYGWCLDYFRRVLAISKFTAIFIQPNWKSKKLVQKNMIFHSHFGDPQGSSLQMVRQRQVPWDRRHAKIDFRKSGPLAAKLDTHIGVCGSMNPHKFLRERIRIDEVRAIWIFTKVHSKSNGGPERPSPSNGKAKAIPAGFEGGSSKIQIALTRWVFVRSRRNLCQLPHLVNHSRNFYQNMSTLTPIPPTRHRSNLWGNSKGS